MTTKKVLQPTNDVFIQFTEEELSSIGAGPGTKFETTLHEDGSIELRPYAKIELEMEEWPRGLLEMIIKESCEKDISVNDVISDLLKQGLDLLAKNEELISGDISTASIDPNFTNNDTSITNS